MRAVSRSRISPIMMMSGSWRTIERSALREVEADLRLGLDLVDARDLVFDRILDGDDLDVGLVELGRAPCTASSSCPSRSGR